ncbi:MAG: tetratricopeptide repeat protein [Chryseobacterium sp.]|uniref:tetratricopeptide repeat protein n=1 Tax=Chryseobacterium sp. TaxID=1871047 RepID=UPI001B27D412|nr:tetratricopeptide repeat protein [Chryseobacterium sp.]MBO6184349.1 tetratricopeptide repeat protein [Chryseobacterium sp.]
MEKIFLVVLSIILLNCSNKERKKEIVANKTITQPINNNFEEISSKSKVQSNETLSIAGFTETEFALSLIFFKESEKTFLNINENYFNVNWDYTIQNESINSNNVLLFKNSTEHIILIPTFSEEFPTFQMIGINKNKEFINYGEYTYSLADFEKLGNTTFDKIKYQIVKQKDGLRIKAFDGQKEILLSDYSKNENNEAHITQSERNEIILLRNENMKEVVHSISLDLNSDGTKENFEINFNQNTINSLKNSNNEIYFESNSLIVKKEIEENNPHDFISYKYYFQNSNNSIVLSKIDFKKETYVKNDDLCNLSYVYLPNKKIHFSEVDFFDKKFLQSLTRDMSLNQAIEIVTKTNQHYNCTSNLSTIELEFLLEKTFLDDNSVNNYNNLAYYLEQNKQYEESCYLLKKITQKYPNRVVAWLNYGDALWMLAEKSDAKNAYQKYTSLMKSQHKDVSKIPRRVYDRVK